MYTRRIAPVVVLSLVIFLTPNLWADDLHTPASQGLEMITELSGSSESSEDTNVPSEDADTPMPDLPSPSIEQEPVVERPVLPSPPRLPRTNQVPARRIVEPTQPNEPQPLIDAGSLQLPHTPAPPSQLPSSTPGSDIDRFSCRSTAGPHDHRETIHIARCPAGRHDHEDIGAGPGDRDAKSSGDQCQQNGHICD